MHKSMCQFNSSVLTQFTRIMKPEISVSSRISFSRKLCVMYLKKVIRCINGYMSETWSLGYAIVVWGDCSQLAK